MLAIQEYDASPQALGHTPTLVLMHFLGGSGREWDEVAKLLNGAMPLVTVDLPGFGGSAEIHGYSVTEMADAVQATIRSLRLKDYILVGHSMSGKVSAVIARREEDCVAAGGKSGLRGLILVAPSPAGPEPMSDEKRAGMIALLGERHDDDLARARQYITKNEMRDIPKPVEQRATREVLRMKREAWIAWIERGSREDWSDYVGKLQTPTMVVAGDKDLTLGPDQMHRVVAPHLGQGRMCTVRGCSHLVPMEMPHEMASLMLEFVRSLRVNDGAVQKPEIPAEYKAFLRSDRLSDPTKAVIAARIAGPAAAGGVLTADQGRTLRALVARIVPQQGAGTVDVAGYIMARLARGKGDGWRYAGLPEDGKAYREGLDRLRAQGFLDLDNTAQDEVLAAIASEKTTPAARWFEEVRSDAVSAYIAHPATLARIGYSGLGVGGAETPHKGYISLEPNGREDWEPRAQMLKRPARHVHSAAEARAEDAAG